MNNDSDFKQFLQPSEYLDSDNPVVVAQSKKLTAGCKSESEIGR